MGLAVALKNHTAVDLARRYGLKCSETFLRWAGTLSDGLLTKEKAVRSQQLSSAVAIKMVSHLKEDDKKNATK